jgi:hypothetical protein
VEVEWPNAQHESFEHREGCCLTLLNTSALKEAIKPNILRPVARDSWFEERRRDVADLKRLDELARIGSDFIGLQFRLTPDDVTRSLDQLWILGYCFGVLDAVGQTAELEEPGEELAVVAVGFFLLMSDEAKGADMMRQALDHEADPRFARGSLQGGNDMFAWLADTAKVPSGLSKPVNESSSED